MRSVLVDWLIGVHMQFKLLPETVYTAVAILDRYKLGQKSMYLVKPLFRKNPVTILSLLYNWNFKLEPFVRFLMNDVTSISRNTLQLVGVTAMLIASKYEEIYAPEVTLSVAFYHLKIVVILTKLIISIYLKLFKQLLF